ncbi:MAG TPA: hypothetical protein VFJ58_16990 [Armatimonadota bacterium]|nr:hypothetical protein [Armatimonadota bacterium]
MKVKEIHVVGNKRLHLTVQCPSWRPFRTGDSPHLPRVIFQLFPDLTLDKCENDFGLSFEEECQDTEIPHLFEHLVMEMQGQSLNHAHELTGVTYWDWTVDPRGCFHVEVDYENELLAIAAVRLAERLINSIDQRRLDALDLDWELERLRQIAALTDPGRPRSRGKPGVSRSGPSARRNALVFALGAAGPVEEEFEPAE